MSPRASEADSPTSIELDGDHVRIHDLSVGGALVDLVRAAVTDGRDREIVVRRALDIGAAIMVHGAAKGTVDAVAAEVDRLLALLSERSSRIEALSRMREQVSAAVGLSFEQSVGPRLDKCFAPFGDELDATGTTPGIADEKVGDFVVTLNPRDTGGRDRRIVFELKKRRARATVKSCLAELDRAMLNRDAQVAVMVFGHPSQSPLQGRPFRAFHGNRVLVLWDPDGEPGSDLALEVAAQVARTLAIASEREDLTLDRALLAEKLDALTNVIQRGHAIKRGISTAWRGLEAAEDAYDILAEEAIAVVLELQDRV